MGTHSQRCYNIATNNSTATINMYGQVVEQRPVRYTGEPDNGNYIVLSEFLQDLEKLKGMQRVDIYLASLGGDAAAGVAIRNRLLDLQKTALVTVTVDSSAASAGSMILQGATKGHRYVRSASEVMVHPVSAFLWGQYDTAGLQEIIKRFESMETVYIAAYTETGGQTEEQVRSDMAATTWMVGQVAVEKGYADKVLENESGVEPYTTAFAGVTVLNQAVLGNPKPSNQGELQKPGINKGATGTHSQSQNKPQKEGSEMKEIKTLDDLKAAFPDLMNQAVADAVQQERERIRQIEEMTIPGGEAAANAAKYENHMSAEAFAVAEMKRAKLAGANYLQNAIDDANASGASGVQNSGNFTQNSSQNEILDAVKKLSK